MAFTRSTLILWSAIILLLCTNAVQWNLSNEDHSLARTALFIIRKHLSAVTPTIKLAYYSNDPEMAYKNAAILDFLLQNLHENISIELNFKPSACIYYILIVESDNAFDHILTQITHQVENPSFYLIILITTKVSNKSILEIFTQCSWYQIYDVNIITFSPENGVVSMYIYDLFTEEECNEVQSFVYFTFDQDSENLKTIFPKKLHNLYQCPLIVMAQLIPPFLTFKGNFSDPQPVGDWENLAGFEGMLLKHLSHALNFTIKMLPFVDYMECFVKIRIYQAAFAIGGLNTGDPFIELVSTSIVYYNTELMHVVHGKELSSLSILVKPFSTQLWLLIAVILGAIIYSILQLRAMNPQIRQFILGENNNMPFINIFGILVGYGVTEPRRNFARICFMMFVILTLILRTGYQGAQFEAIQKDKIFAPLPTGINQLVKENYSFLLPEVLASHENEYYIRLLSKDKTSILGLYKQGSVIFGHSLDFERLSVLEETDGNNASIVLRDSLIHYMAETYRRKTESQLFMINEVAFKYQMGMVFPRYSMFLSAFNDKLQYFINSGIIMKLTKEMNQESDKRREAMRSVNKKLTVESLQGVFKIYSFLILASIGVFGLEMLSKCSNILEKVFEFIH